MNSLLLLQLSLLSVPQESALVLGAGEGVRGEGFT